MKVAIQGELGSNSHMAALAMLADQSDVEALEIAACANSMEVFRRVLAGEVDAAVLPIENSLHGPVSEHYDLLLGSAVRIVRESLLRVRHNLIVRPGIRLEQVRRALSHPVALSQCRRWLAAHSGIEAVNFYDTAGSIKHLMAEDMDDTAGIAPALAAQEYGAEVLVAGIEDHAENFTRFFLLIRDVDGGGSIPGSATGWSDIGPPNKASLAFSVEHRPGTLVLALEALARAGVNLTKIESRPVHGSPWEYVFFVDLRFDSSNQIETALTALGEHCRMVKELGRYTAA